MTTFYYISNIIRRTLKVGLRSSHAFIGVHSVYGPGSVCYGGIDTNYGWCSRGVMLGTDVGRTVNTFGDGDVIRMVLNVERKELAFYQNVKLTDVVFDDIDISTNYHLMIRVNGTRSFQITDFEIEKYDCSLRPKFLAKVSRPKKTSSGDFCNTRLHRN